MKILFCNTAWMKYYQGATEEDVPKNGGKYIDKNQIGGEVFNFNDYNRKCFGYVMSRGNLNLDKHYKGISSRESQSEGFTIIWCANNDDGGSKIVGWYENATVYREQQFVPSFTDEGSCLNFNFVAESKDCHLLPEDKRIFKIERASVAGKGNGFGQSNVWYAESAYARNELIPKVIEYIKEYKGEFINFIVTDEIINAVTDDVEIKSDYDKLFEKGIESCNEEEYEKALKYFNTARTLNETPEVLYNIGYVLFLYHCFDEAIALFEKCIELDFAKEDTISFLIHAYDYSGNYEKSLGYCKKIIDLLEKPETDDETDYRIFYCTVMCQIYVHLSDFKNATDIANQILTYANDEETKEEVRGLLSYIKEVQER